MEATSAPDVGGALIFGDERPDLQELVTIRRIATSEAALQDGKHQRHKPDACRLGPTGRPAAAWGPLPNAHLRALRQPWKTEERGFHPANNAASVPSPAVPGDRSSRSPASSTETNQQSSAGTVWRAKADNDGGTVSQGTRTDLDEPLSNGKTLAGGGNTGAYLLRRLARSHPATLAASSLTADGIVERLVQRHGLDEVIAFPKRSVDWLAQTWNAGQKPGCVCSGAAGRRVERTGQAPPRRYVPGMQTVMTVVTFRRSRSAHATRSPHSDGRHGI
jgi:hypothetical protein